MRAMSFIPTLLYGSVPLGARSADYMIYNLRTFQQSPTLNRTPGFMLVVKEE